MGNLSFDFSELPGTADPWGPSNKVPVTFQFNDVPYAPFSKTDKLGKVADWQQAKEEDLPRRYQERRRDQYHAYGASAAKLFGAEANEENFSIVDTNTQPESKQTILRGGRRGGQMRGGRSDNGGRGGRTRGGSAANNGWRENGRNERYDGRGGNTRGGSNNWNNRGGNNWNNRGGNNWNNRGNSRWGGRGRYNNSRYASRYYNREEQNKDRSPSIKIESDWPLVSEIELNKLTKLNLVVKKAAETISTYGTLNVYNKKFELFRPEPLKQSKRSTPEHSATKDPVLQKLATDEEGGVFATDSVLAQLMCAVRSAYSWDIIVTKRNGSIYFDRRPGTDRIEVDENSQTPPTDEKKESIDSATSLSEEATAVNRSFVANSITSATHKLEHPELPFESKAEVTFNTGYKYVKYSLPTGDDEHPLNIYVRSQADAFQEGDKLVSVNALNQYNPTAANDWKTKLVSGSRGVIFASELKKNNNRIARWTAQAMLGDLNALKIGFVSRKLPTNNTKHVVVGALTFAPAVLSAQIRLSMGNGWGIIKSLIDIIDHEGGDEDYKFLIFRAPGIPKLSIYKLPLDAFEE